MRIQIMTSEIKELLQKLLNKERSKNVLKWKKTHLRGLQGVQISLVLLCSSCLSGPP